MRYEKKKTNNSEQAVTVWVYQPKRRYLAGSLTLVAPCLGNAPHATSKDQCTVKLLTAPSPNMTDGGEQVGLPWKSCGQDVPLYFLFKKHQQFWKGW